MAQEPAYETTPRGPAGDSLVDLFRSALPGVRINAEQTAIDLAMTVRREDLLRVMQTAKEGERLAFDFLRSLSGVDHVDELEVVYHLYSYRLGHSAAVKARCPPDDPHLPSVSHLWQTANWHEREAAEMFGFVFDGHPDLRPLLTEEGLGYYPLRKMHPFAEIEEWQEDYVKAAEAGVPTDERAREKVVARKKAAIRRKAREEARAEGLSATEEKAAVAAAIKAFEEQEAAIIKEARQEARDRGASAEEERQAVADALEDLLREEESGD